jgi:hypothetical protein
MVIEFCIVDSPNHVNPVVLRRVPDGALRQDRAARQGRTVPGAGGNTDMVMIAKLFSYEFL